MVASTSIDHVGDGIVELGYHESDDEAISHDKGRRSSFSGPIARRRASNDCRSVSSRKQIAVESSSRRISKRHSFVQTNAQSASSVNSCKLQHDSDDEGFKSRLQTNNAFSTFRKDEDGGPQKCFKSSSRRDGKTGGISEHMSSASLDSTHKGIDPAIVARMSRRSSIGNNEDDDEEDDTNSANGYGYCVAPKQHRRSSNASKQSRRNSAAGSVSSRASRSKRRQSYLRNKDPLAAVYTHKKTKDDCSDLDESSASDCSDPYGYSHQSFGYESSASVSDSEVASISSSKRSRRRNSCIIRPEHHSISAIGLPTDPTHEADYVDQDENDPDSLLNRAKGQLKAHALKKDNFHEASEKEDQELLFEDPPTKTVTSSASRREIGAEVSTMNSEAFQEVHWRKAPLTSFYAAPTAENLKQSLLKGLTTGAERDGWGDLDVIIMEASSNPESSEKKSEQSYGASMYTAVVDYQEIDKYKQKARRRASLEDTCLDIDNYINQKYSKVPHFKPAEGCRNASDFVVRCFSARLRVTGFTVLKHNRSRWSKAKHRVIYLMPDGKTLSWRATEDDKDFDRKAKRPQIDLSSCIEIRHAWSPDPKSKSKRGTALLRSRCKPSLAGKSFSLIFGKRSLDFTAFSNDQCKVLMEGFSALCFRLKLASKDSEHSSQNTGSKQFSEEDWASTVYGSTANTTVTTSSVPPPSSWGY